MIPRFHRAVSDSHRPLTLSKSIKLQGLSGMSRHSRYRHYGRVQMGIHRAFRAQPPGSALTTAELLKRTHPRIPNDWKARENPMRAVRWAADRLCVRAGRVWPHGIVWRLKDD
jgi:hypothetical protein